MAAGKSLSVEPLKVGTPELLLCARWRYDAFLKSYGLTEEDSLRQLERVIAPGISDETALLARVDGEPAGICMLVRDELDARHDVSPWLASLFVPEHFRRQGIGQALVHAIEDFARQRGRARIHLYTDEAEGFYTRCWWLVDDRFDWDGISVVLMSKAL